MVGRIGREGFGDILLCLEFFKKFRVVGGGGGGGGGVHVVNLVFCFGPKLWFLIRTKLSKKSIFAYFCFHDDLLVSYLP